MNDESIIETTIPFTYASSCIITLCYLTDNIKEELPKGTGFIASDGYKGHISAATFTSQKWENRCGKNVFLVRCFISNFKQNTMPKQEFVIEVIKELNKIIGINANPVKFWKKKWTHSLPQYKLGHLDRVEVLRKRLALNFPNLFVAGCTLEGVGIPDCIRQGMEAGNQVLNKNK